MARLYVEFAAEAGGDAVVEFVGYVHAHLRHHAVGREAFHIAGIGVVEVALDFVAYHVADFRAKVDEAFEAAAAEVDMRHDGQAQIGERSAVVQEVVGFLEVLFPAALLPAEFGYDAENAFFGVAERYGAGCAVEPALCHSGRERHPGQTYAAARAHADVRLVVCLGLHGAYGADGSEQCQQ